MSIVHKKIEHTVRDYLKNNLPFDGVEIFDVTYRRERAGNVLRVIIDGENVGLEECSNVSNFVSEWLDNEDLIEAKYFLEVSTPGIDRPLRNQKDFLRYKGKVCKITLINPVGENRKNFKGKIMEVNEDKIIIYVEHESKQFEIDIKNIKKAKLEIDF